MMQECLADDSHDDTPTGRDDHDASSTHISSDTFDKESDKESSKGKEDVYKIVFRSPSKGELPVEGEAEIPRLLDSICDGSTESSSQFSSLNWSDASSDRGTAGSPRPRHVSFYTGDVELPPLHTGIVDSLMTLSNVEYLSSIEDAESGANDLSTMDEPITKDLAKDVFCRRVVPLEIPVPDVAEDVSTIYGGKHDPSQGDEENESYIIKLQDNLENGFSVITQKQSNLATDVEARSLDEQAAGMRSNLEVFFLVLIAVSGVTIITLLAVVLAGN